MNDPIVVHLGQKMVAAPRGAGKIQIKPFVNAFEMNAFGGQHTVVLGQRDRVTIGGIARDPGAGKRRPRKLRSAARNDGLRV